MLLLAHDINHFILFSNYSVKTLTWFRSGSASIATNVSDPFLSLFSFDPHTFSVVLANNRRTSAEENTQLHLFVIWKPIVSE